jgi:hypothetical protein
MSVSALVPRAEHFVDSHPQRMMLAHLGKTGVLDKLHVLDEAMGVSDRHEGNWVLSPNGKNPGISLIDNELAGTGYTRPSYMDAYKGIAVGNGAPWTGRMHPEAAKWALQLQPAALEREMHRHGVPEHDISVAVRSLTDIQNKIKRGAR